jgi:hypothetical protein
MTSPRTTRFGTCIQGKIRPGTPSVLLPPGEKPSQVDRMWSSCYAMPARSPLPEHLPRSHGSTMVAGAGTDLVASQWSATARKVLRALGNPTWFWSRHLHLRCEPAPITALRPERPGSPRPALLISWNTRAKLLYMKQRGLSTTCLRRIEPSILRYACSFAGTVLQWARKGGGQPCISTF